MKKILVVDDDLAIQEILSKIITEKTDFKVFAAEDGEVALDQIENDPPDLILLDVILPRINGLAFLMLLRKMESAKNIPVIFMSGQMVDENFKKESIELGAVDFIEKPFKHSLLLEKINSILSTD